MTDITSMARKNDDCVVKFKYFKADEAAKAEAFADSDHDSVRHLKLYAKNINAVFLKHIIKTYVCYIFASKTWKCWEVS